MTKSKWIQLIFAVLTGLWMVVIFLFSAQNGETSSETSGQIVDQIAPIVIKEYDKLPEPVRQSKEAILTLIVRKSAHFSEYAFLGLLTFFALPWNKIKRLTQILTAFGIGTFYAITDEFHQTFSDGRSPAVVDVLIDSAGVLSGILLAWLLYRLISICLKRKRNRKKQS